MRVKGDGQTNDVTVTLRGFCFGSQQVSYLFCFIQRQNVEIYAPIHSHFVTSSVLDRSDSCGIAAQECSCIQEALINLIAQTSPSKG